MDVAVFARGFGLGFSIAAVLGPIGVLCLRRSLASGFRLGFVSGLGAATADATYAAIAAFGVSAVAALLVDQRFWFRLVGGAFLLYLGVQSMRASVAIEASPGAAISPGASVGSDQLDVTGASQASHGALTTSSQASRGVITGRSHVSRGPVALGWAPAAVFDARLFAAYATTLGLTLSNPMTILSFGAIFAGLGIRALEAGSPAASVALVAGVFSGSAAWWLVLASAGARLRRWITSRRLRWVNIASGLVIVAFGVQSLVAAVASGAS